MNNYIAIIMSLSCIGIGFLVKRFPYPMKGYGRLSAKEKGKLDIDKIRNITYNGLITTGIILFVLHYIFKFLDQDEIANLMLLVVPMTIMLVVNLLSLKYDHNLRTRIGTFIRIIFFIFLLLTLITNFLKLNIS